MIENNMEQDKFLQMLKEIEILQTKFEIFSLISDVLNISETKNMEDLELLLENKENFFETVKTIFYYRKDIDKNIDYVYSYLKSKLPIKGEEKSKRNILMKILAKPTK